MSNPTIRIHDTAIDKVIDREMTDAEYAQYQADKEIETLAAEAKAKADADKAALLARLGLTEDELKTILG
jgi:hypothetical protein